MSKKTITPTEESAPSLQFIPLDQIVSSPLNPRKTFDQAELEELAASIGKLGVIQAITVRPAKKGYEVVCGDRRLRAAGIAGLAEIPASVRNLTDQEAMELMVTENLQRKDVAPLEEAEAYEYMRDKMSYDIASIAAKIGKHEGYVVRRLQLTKLIPDLKEALKKNEIGIGHAELLARIPADDQKAWLDNTLRSYSGAGSIKDLRWYLSNRFEKKLSGAVFDTTIKVAGVIPCTQCPSNSAFNSTLFPDRAEEAICHNSTCFKKKSDAHFSAELDKALKDPDVVLISVYSYEKDRVIEKLQKDGYSILKQYDDYENYRALEAPEKPELSDYDPDNYESDDERQEDYQDDLKIYESDLQEYNIELGKLKGAAIPAKRGFMVNGDARGSYKYVKLKSKGSAKSASQGANAELIEQKSTIEQKLKRGRELDREKIMAKLVPHMRANFKTGPLSEDELFALFAAAFNEIGYGSGGNELKEKLGFSGRYTAGNGPELVEALSKASPDLIGEIVRTMFFGKYSGIYPDSLSGGIMFHLAKEWCPDALNEFTADQDGVRERREAKLNKQLEDLDAEIKDSKKSKKKPAEALQD